jgi:hypothetical protein
VISNQFVSAHNLLDNESDNVSYSAIDHHQNILADGVKLNSIASSDMEAKEAQQK